MFILMIILYVSAALLLGVGVTLYFQFKKSEKFGEREVATIIDVKKAGIGVFKKYSADVTYKVAKKKYKGKLLTNFYQPMVKNGKIQIRYNVLNPADIIPRANDAFRVFNVLAAIIFIVANYIFLSLN